MLIDTHCHLDFPEFQADRDQVIKRAQENSIAYIINIGSSLQGSGASVALAQNYDFIYAAVGCHPHQADGFNPDSQKQLRQLAGSAKVVAIGEIGLDYTPRSIPPTGEPLKASPGGLHYKNYSQAENQQRLFKTLLGLANDLGLPAVIHNRGAEDDTLKILRQMMPKKAVVHCFSGNQDFLARCLDAGFFISFTANITYKNAVSLRELVKAAPLERLMLETDAPFLPPQDFRGRRNEPGYVEFVAREVARIKQSSLEAVAEITSANAKAFFNLK